MNNQNQNNNIGMIYSNRESIFNLTLGNLVTSMTVLSNTKGIQYQSINDMLKANEKKGSANNSFNNDNPNLRSNSPIRNLNQAYVTNSPKNSKSIVSGVAQGNQLQLSNNMSFKPEVTKSLTPTSSVEKPSINFNAYNSNNANTNTGFYNKLLHSGNTNDMRKLAETKRSVNEKKKADMEMKILEEDFNDDNIKESYYNNNKKEEEREREKQSSQHTKKKTGILNLFSKILPK